MNLRALDGPNFSGRTELSRAWVGLPLDEKNPVFVRSAYIGPDPTESLSGIASTVAEELELMAASPSDACAGKKALGELGFAYCLSQNPFTLSGGEQVVVSVIAATAARPERIAIDCALEQLSPPTREALLSYLLGCECELLLTDNRLDEWFDGPRQKLAAAQNAPIIQLNDSLLIDHDPVDIELVDICYSYVKDRPVLRNLSLRIAAGDQLLLTGPNGSGKTTLSKILAGLLRPNSGYILINGRVVEPWRRPGKFVAYNFQNPNYQLFSNLVRNQFDKNREFGDLVKCFSLEQFLDQHPLDLPFVLKKRLTVAATMNRANIGLSIFDEPTLSQDAVNADRCRQIIGKVTNVVISHSAVFSGHKVVRLSDCNHV